MNDEVEALARLLHEAGREAVESGKTVAADHHGEATRRFLEWEEISDGAREGRRMQARSVLARCAVLWKGPGAAEALAVRFHDAYEELAPTLGYTTREETRVFDPESRNGRLMIETCRAILG